jgi:hypothetical protein
MIYSIIYDIKDPERESRFIQALKAEGDNVLFMTHCHFLNSSHVRENIYERLRAVMDGADLLFIAATPLEQISGWLPNSAVKWLKENGI